jgi:hypothetical protein
VRRIVLILVLVVVVAVAGFFLLRPKPAPKPKAAGTSESGSTGEASTGKKPVKGGKTSGRLKPKTAEERKEEKKRIRLEERRRKRELKRRERERRRMLRLARRRRGKRRGRKGQTYVVKAIVSLGTESYAMIDGRRAQVGDVVMGRRIVAIQPDRIEVEAFGRRSSVRVGESLLPSTYTPSRRK